MTIATAATETTMKTQATQEQVNNTVKGVISDWLAQAALQGKKQSHIQDEMGMAPNSNFLTLVKSGRANLPFKRVKELAKICGVSNDEVSRLVEAMLEEYHPDLAALIVETRGRSFNKADSAVIAAVLEAKKEAHEEVRNEASKYAINRSDEQKASMQKAHWKYTNSELTKFKTWIKKNLLSIEPNLKTDKDGNSRPA